MTKNASHHGLLDWIPRPLSSKRRAHDLSAILPASPRPWVMIGLTPWRNTPTPTSILLPSRLTPCMQMRCSSGTSLAPGSFFSTPPSRRLVFLYHQAIHIDWAASVGIFQRPFVVEDQICVASEPVVFKWVARCRSGASTTSECIFRLHGLCIPPGPHCASGIEGNTYIVCGCTDTGSAAGDVRR